MAQAERPDSIQILLGFLLCGGLHLAAFAVAASLDAFSRPSEFKPVLFATLGVSQLLYVIPAWIYLRRKGQRLLGRGLVLAAALTFLVTIGCWGFVMFTLGH